MIFTGGRFSFLAISGLTMTSAPPPSLMTQQSSRCSGSAITGELTTSSTVIDLGQHGVRIVLRVMGGRDLDPGELLAGGAVLMHVAHGAHGVAVGGGQPIGKFPRRLRLVRIAQPRRGAGRLAFAARPAGERDQRDVAFAERDGLGGMRRQRHIGRCRRARWNRRGGVSDSCTRPWWRPGTRRVAGAEIAVDIVAAQSRRPSAPRAPPRRAAAPPSCPAHAGSDARRSRRYRPYL